jgi:hypothetical protein
LNNKPDNHFISGLVFNTLSRLQLGLSSHRYLIAAATFGATKIDRKNDVLVDDVMRIQFVNCRQMKFGFGKCDKQRGTEAENKN